MKVRIFGYRGTAQIPRINPQQVGLDSVQVMYEPYEWRDPIVTNGQVPVTSTPIPNDRAVVIRIEVPDGENIRYEINPPGRAAVADADSPILSGMNYFHWGAGWTISLIDAQGT